MLTFIKLSVASLVNVLNVIILDVIILNIITQNDIMLNVIMLNIIMLNVITLSVNNARCHYTIRKDCFQVKSNLLTVDNLVFHFELQFLIKLE